MASFDWISAYYLKLCAFSHSLTNLQPYIYLFIVLNYLWGEMKSGKCSFLGQIANEMNSFVYIYSCAEVLWMHMQKENNVLLIE